MVKKKKTGTLIILSGPSGAGKGTICAQLLKEIPIDLSISMTTRSPRGNEVDGKDYFFVTRSFFEENIKKGNFLEYAKVHGDNYYGTPKDKVLEALSSGHDVILEIDIQGALKVKETLNHVIKSLRDLKMHIRK